MKDGYFYFPIEPLREKYEDNEQVRPSVIIPVISKNGKQFEVALYADAQTIYFCRIKVPNMKENKISEEDAEIINILKEHLLSVLRLTYDRDVSMPALNFWTFLGPTEKMGLSLEVEQFLNKNYQINADNIRNVYVNTFKIRNQIRLLSDSQDRRIPLQYRFLSLYKILELEFRQKGKWETPDFAEFIARFEPLFKEKCMPRKKLVNYIHELRDKCAHIKSNKNVVGVTELNPKERAEVDKFLPVFIQICTTLIKEKHGGIDFVTTNPNLPRKVFPYGP